MSIPDKFDREFLEWFRARTESAWDSYPQPHGIGWQKGTRWVCPLNAPTISQVEKKWNLTFPPDYRLFLETLHTTNHHPRFQKWITKDQSKLVAETGFQNWLSDDDTIRDRLAWPLEGLLFDLENNNLWLDEWGSKPADLEAKSSILKENISKAPLLIPVLGHRYLLADPCEQGNPVLSIYQADIIVYGNTLRDYLLNELRYAAGLSQEELAREKDLRRKPKIALANIPFWGPISGEYN